MEGLLWLDQKEARMQCVPRKQMLTMRLLLLKRPQAKEQIETEIAALSDNISTLKEQLKSKKSALKVAAKELSKAEAKKVAAEKRPQKNPKRLKQNPY